jgi:hypothetical protein
MEVDIRFEGQQRLFREAGECGLNGRGVPAEVVTIAVMTG